MIAGTRDRTRRLVGGMLTALVGRGSAAAASFLLVPVTIGYLGAETFGLWMTVAALTSMVLWADLGLGNTLMTKLAAAVGRDDWPAGQRLVSSTYLLLGGVALGLLIVLFAAAPLVPWGAVFGTQDPSIAQLGKHLTLLCFAAFLINIPLSLVQRVQYASGRISQSNLWQLVGSLLAVAASGTTVLLHMDPLLVVAVAVLGPLLANLANSAWYYLRDGRQVRPRPSAVSRQTARDVLRIGPLFLVISIASSVSINVDNLLVTHVLGLTAVTELAVPVKVFTLLGLVVSVVNLPLWPLNAEAFAQGDDAWVRRITRRMSLLSVAAVLLPAAVLVMVGQSLLYALTGLDLGGGRWLLVGLALWWTVVAATSPRFMVQNAAGVLAPQLVGWLGFLALSMPLKIWALHTVGLAGLPFTGAALYLLVVVPAAHLGYRRALRRANEATLVSG